MAVPLYMQVSPAESREGNRDCRILNFYDDHDLWHFLSATAMFFSFIVSDSLVDDFVNYSESDLLTCWSQFCHRVFLLKEDLDPECFYVSKQFLKNHYESLLEIFPSKQIHAQSQQ